MLVIALCYAPASAGASGDRENKLFLASSITNSLPYVGQEIVLTYTLYFKEIAPKISNETPPRLQGMWAKETLPARYIKSTPALFHGEAFRSAVIKQFRLVPLQSGEITVSGYTIVCTLPHEHSPANEKEIPDTRLRITAPRVTVSAHALPDPVPEGYTGAVGAFKFELLANKTSIRVGEPLSLKLQLTGTGNLLTLKLPDLHLPESFHQNPPEITTTVESNSLPTTGTITATTIAWPPSAGNYQIPSLRSVVFNPETRQFKTLFSKPLTITVTPVAERRAANNEGSPTTAPEQENKFSPQLIAAAIALLLLMAGAAAQLIKRKEKNIANKAQHAGKADVVTDISTSAAVLKQQLFVVLEKAGIKSPGGLTRVELNQALLELGIPENVQKELPALLDSLDKILYTPTRAKEKKIPDSMRAKVNALLQALNIADGARYKK